MNRLEYLEEENKQQRWRISRFYEFLESLESYTNDFDNFCTCGCFKGVHKQNCQTMYIRRDVTKLLERKDIERLKL